MESFRIPRKRRRHATASTEQEGNAKVEDNDQPGAVQIDESVIRKIKQEPEEYDETSKHEAWPTSPACGLAIQRSPCDRILEPFSPPEVCALQVEGENGEKARDCLPRISSLVSSQKATCMDETNASLVARWMASSSATEVRYLRRSLRHQYRSLARRQPMQNEVTLSGSVSCTSARQNVRRTSKKLTRPNYVPVTIEDGQETPDPQVAPLDLNDVFRRRFRKMLKELVAKRMQKLQLSSVYSGAVSALNRKVAVLERKNKELEEQAHALQSYVSEIHKEKCDKRIKTISRGTQVSMGMILSRSGLSSLAGQKPKSIARDVRLAKSNHPSEGPVMVHVSGQHEQLSNRPSQIQAPFNPGSAYPPNVQPPGILSRSVQNFGTTSMQTQIAHVSTGNSTSGITRPPFRYEEFILPEHRLLGLNSSERSYSKNVVVKRFSDPPSTVTAGLDTSNIPAQLNGPATSEKLERGIRNRNVVGPYRTHGPRQDIVPDPRNGVATTVGPQLAVPVASNGLVPGNPLSQISEVPKNPLSEISQVPGDPLSQIHQVPENPLSQRSQPRSSDHKELYRPPQAIPPDANLRKSSVHYVTTCKANIVSNRAHVAVTSTTQSPQNKGPRDVSSQHYAHIPEKKQLQAKKGKAPQIDICSGGTTQVPYIIRGFHEMLPDSYPNVRHCNYRNESQVSSRLSMARNSRISRARHSDGMQSSNQDTQTQLQHQPSPASSSVGCPPNSSPKKVAENQIGEKICGSGSSYPVCQQGAQWFPNGDCLSQQSTVVTGDSRPCQTVVSSASSVATPRNVYQQIGPPPQLKRSGRSRRSDQTTRFEQEEAKNFETATFVSQEGQPAQMPQGQHPIQHFPHLREILMRPSVPSRYPTNQNDGAQTFAGIASGVHNGSYHYQNSNSSQFQLCSYQTKHVVSQGIDDVSAGEEQRRHQPAWQEQHQQRGHCFQPPSAQADKGQAESHPPPLKKTKPDLEYDTHRPPTVFFPLSSNRGCDLGSTQDSNRFRQPSCDISVQCGETNYTGSRKRSSQAQQHFFPNQVTRGQQMYSTHLKHGHCETNTVGLTQTVSKDRPLQQVLQASRPCQEGLYGLATSGLCPVSGTVQIVNPRSLVSDVKPAESSNLATKSTPHENYRDRHSSSSPARRRQSQLSPASGDGTSQSREAHKASSEQRIEMSNNERGRHHAAIKPVLTAEQCENGIVLSWDLESRKLVSCILRYELFVNSATADLTKLHTWERLGIVDALDLPMACTLSQFVPGATYHFAVRAINITGQNELFSEPCSITVT